MSSYEERKQKRKLGSLWKDFLLNPKSYFIPKTIDEFKSVGLFDLSLTVNSITWYFTKGAKDKYNDFVEIIYSINDITSTVSWLTVHKLIKNELEAEIESKEQQKELRIFDNIFDTILNQIFESRKNYDFYFPVEGIELKNIDAVNLQSVQLIVFGDNLKNIILSSSNVNDNTKERTQKFIHENLLNHLCIKCSFFGDYEKAEEEAKFRARETLNYFRYVICVLKPERIYDEGLTRIRFLSETYVGNNEFLAKNQEDNSVVLVWGRKRSNLENFIIDKGRLQELEEKGFINEFTKIINKDQNTRTKLESCILSAIYWAGEAQNEYDWDIAFLKFWTAIERIFSQDKNKKVTKPLTIGVSVVLTWTGFVEIENIENTRKEVSSLYENRCDIVHKGVIREVKPSQLITICKYAIWTVLGIISLYSTGRETIQEIEEEIREFDNAISSKKSYAEEEVNLEVKIPLSLKHHCEVEAKRTEVTINSVIIEALKTQFGESNQPF